MNHFYT